jgi:nondiscriminating aspartyl-tRNA synthetase
LKLSELLHEQELGDWRRTHYSREILPALDTTQITVMGWVSSTRSHGNIQFVVIRDRLGEIQVTAKRGECSDKILDQLSRIKDHTSLAVRGKVRAQNRSPNGIEVIPSEVRIFSLAKQAAPFTIQANKSTVGIDTRLDLRAIDLRRNFLRGTFRIRHTTLSSIREFLDAKGFIEVNTPKMIATATEGGAALFPIFYYNKEAYLAQSPQLYKEQLTMAFENVYEIGPIFRAEPSRTKRHLSEATSIDVEQAFADYNDLMNLLEAMIKHIINSINDRHRDDLQSMHCTLPNIKTPFPKYRYDEIIDKLQAKGERIRWGDDINPQIMKGLSNEVFNSATFYYIIDWPTAIKPFYVKPTSGSDRSCESFDLMFGSLEISSGSTRINRKESLLGNMKKQGLNTELFDFHLRVFDYGVPPHAGFGVGLERLMMVLLNIENIRDATFYPRDIDRLTP